MAASKPFCPHCGWNLPVAEQAVTEQGTYLPLMLFLTAAICAAIAFSHRYQKSASQYFLAGLAIVLFLSAVVGFYNLRVRLRGRIRALKATLQSQSPSFNTTHGTAAAAQQDRTQQELQRILPLPLPRPTQLTARGKLFLIPYIAGLLGSIGLFAAVIAAISADIKAHPEKFHPDLIFLILPAVLFLVVAISSRKYSTQRALLSTGSVAVGHVTKQAFAGRRQESFYIFYSFPDHQGNTIEGKGIDHSHSYYENMHVLVFFDPSNPSHSLALPCSLFKLDTTP
jgi:hypothetical protein